MTICALKLGGGRQNCPRNKTSSRGSNEKLAKKWCFEILFVKMYISCVRAIIGYAIPTLYHALSLCLINVLGHLERRASSIMLPGKSLYFWHRIENVEHKTYGGTP